MKKILGILAVSTVATIVLASGGTMIYASLSERHSSPKFIANELKVIRKDYLWAQSNFPEQSFMKVNKPIENTSEVAVLSSECIPKDQTSQEQRPKTLVKYLTSKGEPTSFERRQEIASQSGMFDYRGTAEQNAQLLQILINKEEKQNNCEPVSE